MKDLALYIHVPFCQHKCIYCDFYSVEGRDEIPKFLEALNEEISYYSGLHRDKYNIKTIFFGGGTPSYLNQSFIENILVLLKKSFIFAPNPEISLEVNPGTADKSKFEFYRKAGINRLSIGIQCFNDTDLRFLSRIHNSNEAVMTVHEAFEAGFENISIDLIFNLPGQSLEKWKKNLLTALKLPIKHISTYSLIIEEGTPLSEMTNSGEVILNDPDIDASMYEQTIDLLTDAGFIQYEISNFAKPGSQCLHNVFYWSHFNYLGFGPSAHSFMDKRRWKNNADIKLYHDAVIKNGHATVMSEVLNSEQLLEEFIMLGLRSSGIDLTVLEKDYSGDWLAKNKSNIKYLQEKGLLTIKKERVELTRQGLPLCDEILSFLKY